MLLFFLYLVLLYMKECVLKGEKNYICLFLLLLLNFYNYFNFKLKIDLKYLKV